MSKKIRVALLFGGKSAEHEISLRSARCIVRAIDREKYELVLIAISKTGEWILVNGMPARWPRAISSRSSGTRVVLVTGMRGAEIVSLSRRGRVGSVDVVFPVLHGPFGEDGTVQGLLKLANLPFVGAGVLGSAVGMDKDTMKRLMREAGIPTARFLVFSRSDPIDFAAVKRRLGLPVFVKPANLGSSVGISKVKTRAQLTSAIREAFRYDNKILVEENIRGREIECSVLGNDRPIASVPGEIIPSHEFYSYKAKYLDKKGAEIKIPADLPGSIARKIQAIAIKTFRALCCEGMARVDFFLRRNREVIVNEINTIPGFTNISMYPKLWEASGLSYPKLIDRLIELALERDRREHRLRTSFHAS